LLRVIRQLVIMLNVVAPFTHTDGSLKQIRFILLLFHPRSQGKWLGSAENDFQPQTL
jgi:hypothetical protein